MECTWDRRYEVEYWCGLDAEANRSSERMGDEPPSVFPFENYQRESTRPDGESTGQSIHLATAPGPERCDK